jgi:RNA polymerase sigma factor (sigma-70 family)
MKRKLTPEENDMNRYDQLYKSGMLEGPGRALAELLAKDNGRYLYEDLLYMNMKYLPRDPDERDDFFQDFFLDICKGASTYNKGDLRDIDNIKYSEDLKKWLTKCIRSFSLKTRLLKKRRVKITKRSLPRPIELSIEELNEKIESDYISYNGNEQDYERFTSEISFEKYRKDPSKEFPGQRLIDREEKIELEQKRETIQSAVNGLYQRLSDSERDTAKRYFYQGVSKSQILRNKKISRYTLDKLLTTSKQFLEERLNELGIQA